MEDSFGSDMAPCTKELAPKYIISSPVLAPVEMPCDRCYLAASGTTPQGNYLYELAGPADVIITVCEDVCNYYFKGLIRLLIELSLWSYTSYRSFFSLANQSGVLTRHLSNPMTTFTKLSSAEAPGISVHSNRRISKINPNIYAGFTEYVHCSNFVSQD